MLLKARSDVDPESNPFAVIICYGGANLTDTHLASIVHCVGDEIIEWLKRRERCGHCQADSATPLKP
jgi:hypothetical protein